MIYRICYRLSTLFILNFIFTAVLAQKTEIGERQPVDPFIDTLLNRQVERSFRDVLFGSTTL